MIASNSKRLDTPGLVVRRAQLTHPAQQTLWPGWRHHASFTDIELDTIAADEFHPRPRNGRTRHPRAQRRRGARAHSSGRFFANAGWLARAVLAYNFTRWAARLGGIHPDAQLAVACTIRAACSRCPAGSSTAAADTVLRLPTDSQGRLSERGPTRPEMTTTS